MNIFLPHSTRIASNSKTKTYVPLKTILETGGERATGTKTYVPLKTILETGGGGATERSQGFLTNFYDNSTRRTELF